MSREERLCVALDFGTRGEILDAARRFAPRVGWLKVGLEAFTAVGPGIVAEVAETGARVFLDVKLHDIPTTVARAVAAASRSGAAMLNVHAFGGREMLTAARKAAGTGPDAPRLIAVTLLTSLDPRALADLPVAGHPEGIARRLAVLAKECGLDGVVCSAGDLPVVRSCCGEAFFTVVPGIRPSGTAAQDQKRVATPRDALRDGADLLVVGRPVTAAPDPMSALEALMAEIESAPRAIGESPTPAAGSSDTAAHRGAPARTVSTASIGRRVSAPMPWSSTCGRRVTARPCCFTTRRFRWAPSGSRSRASPPARSSASS